MGTALVAAVFGLGIATAGGWMLLTHKEPA